MKRQIYMKGCALFLAAALMFSSHLNAYAVTEEDKQAQEDKIEDLENEKEQANTELDTLQTDKANTEMEIEALDSQLTDIQTQIAQTETDLAQAEEDLEQTKKDLEEAREKEESQYETLKIRINVMYRKGETGYLEILLGADDIASLLNSTEYISRISDYDSNLLQSLQETREQIEELEAQQEAEVERITDLKEDLEDQEAELNTVLDEKAQYIMSLNTNIELTQEHIAELESNIEAEEAALAEIEAEIRAAAAAAAQQQASQSGGSGGYVPDVSGSVSSAVPSASGWVWPSDTTYLTDTYGYQDWRGGLHNGIDIGASYGTPIYAAASGTVWIAGWSDSAGNWVVIDHGGGVLSVYMHASALYVSAGQTVSAGQSIAAVGSTGYSTGPHLHFGVMEGSSGGYDGYWVNPLNYVSP